MLKDAQSQFVAEEHRNRIKQISGELGTYLASFTAAKSLSDEYHSLILDRLEPDGIKIVTDLDKLVAHAEDTGDIELLKRTVAAREHALLARLYANILIGRQDDSFGAKSADEFAKLEAALGRIGDQPLSGELVAVLNEAKELFAGLQCGIAAFQGNGKGAVCDAVAGYIFVRCISKRQQGVQ